MTRCVVDYGSEVNSGDLFPLINLGQRITNINLDTLYQHRLTLKQL